MPSIIRGALFGAALFFALLGLMLVIATLARAVDEHQHGVEGLPDWYDANCCNQQDCRPVPDSDIEFGRNDFGAYVRHIPSDLYFYKEQWRVSQDERMHVCINPLFRSAYCAYLTGGV